MKRRNLGLYVLVLAVSIAGLVPGHGVAAEKTYPSGPIQLIVGFAPGGGTDLGNRLLAKGLEKYLKVPVVPVNKPGAGEVISSQTLASSVPDGQTLASISIGGLVTSFLSGTATYSREELQVIGQYCFVSNVIAVKADAPWRTLEEFIDYAKNNPGTPYGHPGTGTAAHIRTEYLNRVAGLKMRAVPFKGDAGSVPAVLGGHVPIAVHGYTAVKPQLEEGKMRILLCFDPASLGPDPSLRRFREVFGKEVLEPPMPNTYLVAPGKTPKNIVHILESTLEKICKDPEFTDGMGKIYLGVRHTNGIDADKELNQISEQIRVILKETGIIK